MCQWLGTSTPPQRDEHNQYVVGEKGIAQDPWVVPQEGANRDPERRREEEEERDLVVNNTRLTEDMCKEWGMCFPQTWMDKAAPQIFTHRRPAGGLAQLDHVLCRHATG